MNQYPYQIVTFLEKEPSPGEPIYYGDHGWYPQIALKRRFKLTGLSEDDLKQELTTYFSKIKPVEVRTGTLIKTERMPVSVIEVCQPEDLVKFHIGLVAMLGDKIISRYPQRDGEKYYPHITAEYKGEMVIHVDAFTNRLFTLNAAWLVKDGEDENALAITKFQIGQS